MDKLPDVSPDIAWHRSSCPDSHSGGACKEPWGWREAIWVVFFLDVFWIYAFGLRVFEVCFAWLMILEYFLWFWPYYLF